MNNIRDNSMTEIARRIEKRKNELNLSYQDLADLTGMTKSTLQRYVTGKIENIPLSKIDVLASALQTTAEQILGWETKQNLSVMENKELTNKKLYLMTEFEKLSEDKQKLLLNYIVFLNSNNEHKNEQK